MVGTSYGAAQSTTSATFVNSVAGTWGGEYNTYNVTSGNQYEWSLCTADGAVSPTNDSQLTLKNTSNTTLCYSDDLCGARPKILWTATFTGQVRVLVTQYFCATNTSSHTVRWRQVSAVPSGPVSCTNASSYPFSGAVYRRRRNFQCNIRNFKQHIQLCNYGSWCWFAKSIIFELCWCRECTSR